MPIVNDMPINWAGVVIRMNDGTIQGWQIQQPTEFTITREFGRTHSRGPVLPQLLTVELKGYSATWHYGNANIPDLREIESRKAISP